MRVFLVGVVALLSQCESAGHDDFEACVKLCGEARLPVRSFTWSKPGLYECNCDQSSLQPAPANSAPPAGPP